MIWESKERTQFVDSMVSSVSQSAGVYFLFYERELIYIGGSDGGMFSGIRSRLLSHLAGNEGSCTRYADEFSYEQNELGKERERQLLTQYKRLYGRLPKCNDVI